MKKNIENQLYHGLEKAVKLLGRTDWYYELHETRFKKILFITEQSLCHKHNMNVLEIGVWPGYLAMSFVYAGHYVEGVDLDPQRLSGVVNSKINIIKQDLNVKPLLPFDDKKFDLVIASEVVEHLEPEKLPVLLSEIRKKMKDDGTFILTTPNRNQLNSFWEHDDGKEKMNDGHGHMKEYSLNEVSEMFVNVGFDSVKIWYENFYDLVGKKKDGRYFVPIYKLWRGDNFVRNLAKFLSWPVRCVPYLKDSIVVVVNAESNF